jgi:hypothetical protein
MSVETPPVAPAKRRRQVLIFCASGETEAWHDGYSSMSDADLTAAAEAGKNPFFGQAVQIERAMNASEIFAGNVAMVMPHGIAAADTAATELGVQIGDGTCAIFVSDPIQTAMIVDGCVRVTVGREPAVYDMQNRLKDAYGIVVAHVDTALAKSYAEFAAAIIKALKLDSE